MAGVARCSSCINVLAIAPLVPIVPALQKDLHRMWHAYEGFSFAFGPYIDVNMTTELDDKIYGKMFEIIDPMSYLDRLEEIPKLIVVSSDDEFMMMDWTNIYFDQLTGEKHLLILPNAEHTMATGIPDVLPAASAFVRSIAAGHDSSKRPSFDYI